MSQMSRIATIGLLFAALASSVSWAQASADDKAAKERAAREIAEAVAACDKGASAPLDFTAEAAPVQFQELAPFDLDMSALKVLQGVCQRAWVGAPDKPRLQLQWLRVTMAAGGSDVKLLTPQVRKLAREGSAEAQYLLYQLARVNPGATESTPMDVSYGEAMASLIAAAEQGHMAAIGDLMILYRGTADTRRDLKQVVRWARRLESAPPQGIEITPYEDRMRALAPMTVARTTLEEDGFSATENRAAFRFAEKAMKRGGEQAQEASLVVAKALRVGRGTLKDAARAREILEALARKDPDTVPVLADMLMRGEGGPEDGKRALELVRSEAQRYKAEARRVEAAILLAGKVVGYRPQEAIVALTATSDPESLIRLAGLLIDYRTRLDNPDRILSDMSAYAASGRSDVAFALAKLKLSDNSQFTDEEGARALLKPLADTGDRAALWLYASTQYSNLGSTSSRPMRREQGLSDAQLMALIQDGIRREEPEAFLLKAKMLRAGILYPQDDRGASDMLRQAARGDNIEALLLLGDAYDDGLGIAKNKKKRLDAWRRAVALGSIRAKSKIARAFTFDTFDKLMTLEEGVTWRIALYNNGYGRSFEGMGLGSDSAAEMEFMGLFMGRAMEAGTDAVAEAVMNGFREAPAGLEDANLVAMGKALPPEIKAAIESRLARENFYRGSPEGYWGPEARKALAAWVEARGFGAAPADRQDGAGVEEASADMSQKTDDLLDTALIDRIRREATRAAAAAKTSRQKRAALEKVNLLAQYGDSAARWALVPNYHQVDAVRRVVSAAEITRYGLDMMVTRPPGAEKADFEFIFNATQIYQDGKANEFGKAVLDTIRDDVRLQDPLVLGSVLKQFIFAPGACDAVLASAKRAGIDGMGEDGCDDASLGALVSFAKEKGPAGIAERNRKAAAEILKAL